MIINDGNSVRIGITGITGRMGKAIIETIIKFQKKKYDKKIVLGAAITRTQSSDCGLDIGKFIKSDDQGVLITDNIELVKSKFDVLIDFTHPDLTMEYIKFCMINHKNMVIGTTGLKEIHFNLMKSASKKVGIVYSTNFSIGITIMLKLLSEASKIMGNIVDIDIIETHHNQKIDTPSGTSLTMQDVILSNTTKNNGFFDLASLDNDNNKLSTALSSIFSGFKRNNNDIKIHSIRSGDIVGEHVVYFSSAGERLKIAHQAFNRDIFVNGALISAMWLNKDKIGLFGLNDVLGFKE